MVDAQVGLGESLVTGIDIGIGASRCRICFVTPAYIDPDRFSGLRFEDVQQFSALLGDRKGLSTDTHGLDEIAQLIGDSITGDTPH